MPATEPARRLNLRDVPPALGQRVACWEEVPKNRVGDLVFVCRGPLQAYLNAADQDAKSTACCAWLDVPSQHLQKPRIKGARHQREHLGAQLRAAVRGEPFVLPAEMEAYLCEDSERSDEERRAAKAQAKLWSGHASRAMDALMDQPLVEPTEAAVSAMCKLHPRANHVMPDRPDEADRCIHVDELILQRAVNKTCTGASGGPSGWTTELIRQLMTHEQCSKGIAAIVQDMLNGEISGEAAVRLRAAALSLKPKPDGGVRPLAVGEAIRRIAEAYILIAKCPAKAFEDVQFGVGEPCGPERARHIIQCAIECHNGAEDIIAVNFDISNAFNTIDRAMVAEQLYADRKLSGVWRLFGWLYGTPSLLLLYDGSRQLHTAIHSTEGVQQGSAISSLAFAKAIDPFYREALQAAPRESIDAVAIHDDFTVSGPPQHVFAVIDALRSRLPHGNLQLNMSKTTVLWPFDSTNRPVPASVQQQATDRGLTVVDKAAKLVGAPIGTDVDKSAAICHSKLQEYQRLTEALANPFLPSHVAYILLRCCVLPCLNYLARTVPPSTLQGCAAKFDRLITNAMRDMLNLEHDMLEKHVAAAIQFTMPIKAGGFGLRPYEEHISPAAYVASIISAMPDLLPTIKKYQQQFDADDERRHQLPDTPMFRDFIAAYEQQLQVLEAIREDQAGHGREVKDELQLPANVHDVLTVFAAPRAADAPRIQHVLTQRLDKHRALLLKQQLKDLLHDVAVSDGSLIEDDDDENNDVKEAKAAPPKPLRHKVEARLLSASDADGSRWLTQIPRSPGLTLKNHEFDLAVRFRLGLPPVNNLPRTCACKEGKEAIRIDRQPYDHCMSCPLFRRKGTLNRHNFVAAAIADHAFAAGMKISREPHFNKTSAAPADNRLRKHAFKPDLELTGIENRYLVDVMVTHPAANTYCSSAKNVSLYAAGLGERGKNREGIEPSRWLGFEFYPFVVESFGAFGKQAHQLLDIVAQHAFSHDRTHTVSKAAFRSRMATAISIAIQRGNADIFRRGLMEARLGRTQYGRRSWTR